MIEETNNCINLYWKNFAEQLSFQIRDHYQKMSNQILI